MAAERGRRSVNQVGTKWACRQAYPYLFDSDIYVPNQDFRKLFAILAASMFKVEACHPIRLTWEMHSGGSSKPLDPNDESRRRFKGRRRQIIASGNIQNDAESDIGTH
jgi:hypothetical protein